MKVYIAVGIGGVFGAIIRYLISLFFWTEQMNAFPWATFIANISGAFLLTWIIFQPFFAHRLAPITFVALTTGLIGSYTTFSTLMLEFTLLLKNNLWIAIIYLIVTIFGGMLASFLGYVLSQRLYKSEVTS